MSEYVGVPDGFTPVVGWRVWQLTVYDHTDDVYLKGRVSYWANGEPTKAYCQSHPRAATVVGSGQSYTTVPNPNYDAEQRKWLAMHGSNTPSEYDPVRGEHVVKSGPVVLSLTRPVEAGPAQIPSAECSCGMYVASLAEARNYLHPTFGYSSEVGIIGRAALWGTVVEHASGARGEYGYPQAFYVPDKVFEKAAPKLKKAFRVPVFRMSELPDEPQADETAATAGVATPQEETPSRPRRLWSWLNRPVLTPLTYVAAMLVGNALTALARAIHP